MNLSMIQNNNPLPMMSSIYRQQNMKNQNSISLDSKLPSTLSIFNSLTGSKLVTSSFNFQNLDSLKQFIAESFSISIENLFLLTPFGIKLKFSMIVHEEINEIYVFDRKFFNVNTIDSNSESNSSLTNDLLNELNQTELINMIKPMESPILTDELFSFVEKLTSMLDNTKHLKAFDLNMGSLRMLLNSLKRNSGWASALLSDFKKTMLYEDNNIDSSSTGEDVEIILTSLNVLIQYVGLVFKNLEKRFNDSIDSLILLQTNSLIDKWRDEYNKLKNISFQIGSNKLVLSDLVNDNELEGFSNDSKKLSQLLNERLVIMKSKIENDVMLPKRELIKEYDVYMLEFMKDSQISTDDKDSVVEDCKKLLVLLESKVIELIQSSKNLPSFEGLITTSGSNSTNLSSTSLENIRLLINNYKNQELNLVPEITKLSNDLYQVQLNKLNVRKEVQRKLISSTLVSITKIQLSIMRINSSINQEITKNLNLLKENELQLSIVSDLPLIFGIWSIANLNNLKYGLSLTKILNKTNEIFEMFKFIETKNRLKWLDEFILNSGGNGSNDNKLEFLNLSEEEKDTFINDNLLSFKFVSNKNEKRSDTYNQDQVLSTNSPSNENHYMNPINKLFHNINSFPIPSRNITPDVQRHDNQLQLHNQSKAPTSNPFFVLLSHNISVNDVTRYISSLKAVGVDSRIIHQLEGCLKDFGLASSTSLITKNEDGEDVIVKGSDVQGLGSFDANDLNFMKLFKKFIKSFEIEGIMISIESNSNKSDSLNNHGTNSNNEELIKGYERRIKKLENLLHQRNFQQFNDQWSHRGVSSPPPPGNMFNTQSSQHQQSQLQQDRRQSDPEQNNPDGENTILFNDDVGLGRKVIGLPPSVQSEKVNKLTKENEEMLKELAEFRKNPINIELIDTKKQLNHYKKESKLLEKSNKDKDLRIQDLEKQLGTMTGNNESLTEANNKLENANTELKNMKSDLLENMSQKEIEFTKESKINQEEINELKLKLEELEEDELNLIKVNKSLNERLVIKDQLLCNLYELIQNLYTKLNQLSTEIFSNLTRVCLLLESIGLLLLRETPSFDNNPGELTIKRVKGLRSRKKQIKQSSEPNGNNNSSLVAVGDTTLNEFDNDQIDNALMEVVSSEVVPEAEQYLHWVDMNVLNYTLSSDLGIEEELIQSKNTLAIGGEFDLTEELKSCEESSIEKKIKKLLSNYSNMSIDLGFQNFLKFNHVDNELIVERVFRRFNDVETLARKLQKEKNLQKTELKELISDLNCKISIKSFKIGDLVLFLRTLTPIQAPNSPTDNQNSNENSPLSPISESSTDQPWAAFNIGSPNYYLKNFRYVKNNSKTVNENYIDLTTRDWFVGRITNIDSKSITDDNVGNSAENPFRLSKGQNWYYVEAKEEKFGVVG